MGNTFGARGYFVETSEQMSAKDFQRCLEEKEAHHKQNNCKIYEF